MYATHSPSVGIPALDNAIHEVLGRLTVIAHLANVPDKPRLERMSLLGQEEALSEFLQSLYSVLEVDGVVSTVMQWEQAIQMRTLATLVWTRLRAEERTEHVLTREKHRLNSMEWHAASTGKRLSWQFAFHLLKRYGIEPLPTEEPKQRWWHPVFR